MDLQVNGNGGASKFQLSGFAEVANAGNGRTTGVGAVDTTPRLCGMPLKYISLITLAVQNAFLTIIMHYSRVSIPPSRTYSAASAVLLNELLKGFISLAIVFIRIDEYGLRPQQTPLRKGPPRSALWLLSPTVVIRQFRRVGKEVFSPDCWKLSIPAILYVIQNNLQYVAASNLEAATFQVSYQMKILTTAAFSVLLLRKRLYSTKWLALLALAVGVGIVQIQSGSGKSGGNYEHEMHPFTGFVAVAAACFTSGLAGVYFEMVLKNSQTDLWVRNVQLSLFSLLPALVPVLAAPNGGASAGGSSWFWALFANFGGWAWATVATQVFGGLVTAIVIKYSDNILKGFATSLSIVLSFLASVALFDFRITPSFLVGASTVLAATWLYNQPEARERERAGGRGRLPQLVLSVAALTGRTRKGAYATGSPVEPASPGSPILGQLEPEKKRPSLGSISPRALAAALRLTAPPSPRASVSDDGVLAGRTDSLVRGGSASGQSTPSFGTATPFSPATTPPPSAPPSRMPSSAQLSSGLIAPGAPASFSVVNGYAYPVRYSVEQQRVQHLVVHLDEGAAR